MSNLEAPGEVFPEISLDPLAPPPVTSPPRKILKGQTHTTTETRGRGRVRVTDPLTTSESPPRWDRHTQNPYTFVVPFDSLYPVQEGRETSPSFRSQGRWGCCELCGDSGFETEGPTYDLKVGICPRRGGSGSRSRSPTLSPLPEELRGVRVCGTRDCRSVTKL